MRQHLASVDSTNAHARRLIRAGALDSGVLHAVTATEQTAGRGRLDRSWASSAGDIKLTLAFTLPRGDTGALSRAYLLSPLLAVAACEGSDAALLRDRALLTSAGGRLRLPPLGIKWPNDIICGGARKVGGILCELEAVAPSASGSGVMWALLGIGLNVNSRPAALGVRRPIWPLTTLLTEAEAAASAAETVAMGPTEPAAADSTASPHAHSMECTGAAASFVPQLDLDALTSSVVDRFADVSAASVRDVVAAAARDTRPHRALQALMLARRTALCALLGPAFHLPSTCPSLPPLQRLEAFMSTGCSAGSFLPEYRARSVLIGRRVSFQNGPETVAGVVVDTGDDGALHVAVEPPVGGAAAAGGAGAAAAPAVKRFLSGEVTGLELASRDGSGGSGGGVIVDGELRSAGSLLSGAAAKRQPSGGP